MRKLLLQISFPLGILIAIILFAWFSDDVELQSAEADEPFAHPYQTEPLTIQEWQDYVRMADEVFNGSVIEFAPVNDDLDTQLHEKVEAFDYSGTEFNTKSSDILQHFVTP